MRILLTSAGLTTEAIIRASEELVGKNREDINVVMINEAIKGESGNHRWFIEDLLTLSRAFGGDLEFIDIQSNSLEYCKQRIAVADVIYCFGGSPDYLMNTFVKKEFDKILPEILKEKVWIGSSAGSCVLCHKEPDEIQEKVYHEHKETDGYMDIVPIIFLPHLHGYADIDENIVAHASELSGLPTYAISDESAIVVKDGKIVGIIGDDYIAAGFDS